MKRFVIASCILIGTLFTAAQMDIPPVGFNPRATITEEVGITSITIKYSRPGVKGREGKIWGRVVPNGFGAFSFITYGMSSPWRAGANEATLINFEHDVKVGGKELKAGLYALFMAMNTDSVMLIFSKQTDAWGSFYYKQSEDVLRITVKPVVLDKSVEWLKYEFIEHKEKSCVIALQWENLSVPFTVEVDVENLVLARMRSEFTGIKSFVSANKLQASMYCFSKNINMEEAIGWAQSAITGKPFGQSGYDAYENLATGYEKLNQLAKADSVMNEGLQIATIDQYTGYGRKLLTKKRYDRALEIMLKAEKKFGDVYAVNNGLAYAYSSKADYKKALEFANKALAQAPAHLKAVATSNVEKLRSKQDINQ